MKRLLAFIISLILIASLICMLGSCDILKLVPESGFGGEDNQGGDGGIVTTITEDELKALFDIDNFTFEEHEAVYNTSGEFLGDSIRVEKVTPLDLYLQEIYIYGDVNKENHYYLAHIDGNFYCIRQIFDDSDEYYAIDPPMGMSLSDNKIGRFFTSKETFFEYYIYNPETKSYDFTRSNGYKTSFFFENGQIKKIVHTWKVVKDDEVITLKDEILTFSDIGTTVIEIPEYTVMDNEAETGN